MRLILKIVEPLKKGIRRLFKDAGFTSFLLIGLPEWFPTLRICVYGISGCSSSRFPGNGNVFHDIFGLGTFPAMLAVSLFGKLININIRRKISRAVPVFAVILAMIFILRGLNLGIPYLSPKMMGHNTQMNMMNH